MTRRAEDAQGAAHWRERFTRRDASNPLLLFALGLLFVAVLALILLPNRPRTATLTPDAIGRVADSAISATHDFAYEANNPAGMAAIRDEAAARVLPVWDYNADLAGRIDASIRSAFGEARDALEDAARARRAVARQAALEAIDELAPGSGEGSAAGRTELAEDEDDRIALDEWLPDAGDRVATLQAVEVVSLLVEGTRAPDAVLLPFAADGFSVQAEDALRALVRAAMDEYIIEDIRAFDDVQSDGISLRTLEGVRPTDVRVVRHFGRFHDLTDIDELINQARHHLRYIEVNELQIAIEDLARSLVEVNTVFNRAETNARRREATEAASALFRETLTQNFQAGELLVAAGEIIDEERYAIVARMAATAAPEPSRFQRTLAAVGLLLLVILPILVFAFGNLRRFTHQTRDLAMMATLLVAHVAITDVGGYLAELVAQNQSLLATDAMKVVLPCAAGSMLVRILTNAENALIYSVVYALLSGLLFDFDVTYVAVALVSSLVGSAAVRSAQTRTDILSGGAIVGVMMLALTAALLLGRADDDAILSTALFASLSGLTSALLVYALLPILETTFRYTTPMRLMELANLNHPALKELILKAPGSYHHSMMVGQLVEAACEAVGADALLGRVGAYFHDIGKTKSPQYFAENQSGTNPHDKLRPNMSALVIKAHVKDGVELARQYKLPDEMIDFIREHHGTSLIQYFYRKAKEEADGEVSEEDYRYPGPKPQSRETAICMLADGVEAASRALPDPSHAHLKGLVQRMINKAFTDGQLDACDLTLKDLNAIAQAFLLRLTAFYHHRPEYPDAPKRSTTRLPRLEAPAPPTEEQDDLSGDSAGDGADGGGTSDVQDESGVHLRRLDM